MVFVLKEPQGWIFSYWWRRLSSLCWWAEPILLTTVF